MFNQALVKMLGREAGIAVAIKRLHLCLPFPRNPLARYLAKPPIQQACFALIRKSIAPTPKRSLANP